MPRPQTGADLRIPGRSAHLVLQRGDSGPVVKAVQQAGGADADGSFGPLTQAAVTSRQRAHDVPATGVIEVRLRLNPHRGNHGARTKARVQTFRRTHHVRATGTVGPATWSSAPEGSRHRATLSTSEQR